IGARAPQLHRGARYEADRGIEIRADAFVLHRHIDEVVGIVDFDPGRVRIASQITATGRQAPYADEKILVAAEFRRGVGKIRARQPAAGTAERIADRRDRTDPGLLPEIAFDAPDAHERAGVDDAILRTRADSDSPESRIADTAIDLAASKDRHGLIAD